MDEDLRLYCYRRAKLDPDLDSVSGELLDNAAAKHKLSVKPRRTHASSRHSPSRTNLQARYVTSDQEKNVNVVRF